MTCCRWTAALNSRFMLFFIFCSGRFHGPHISKNENCSFRPNYSFAAQNPEIPIRRLSTFRLEWAQRCWRQGVVDEMIHVRPSRRESPPPAGAWRSWWPRCLWLLCWGHKRGQGGVTFWLFFTHSEPPVPRSPRVDILVSFGWRLDFSSAPTNLWLLPRLLGHHSSVPP